MEHARRHVPRSAHIPLHVGIKGEQFAIAIESAVERIAQTTRDQLDAAIFGIIGDHMTGGQFHRAIKHAAIPRIWQHLIARVIPQR